MNKSVVLTALSVLVVYLVQQAEAGSVLEGICEKCEYCKTDPGCSGCEQCETCRTDPSQVSLSLRPEYLHASILACIFIEDGVSENNWSPHFRVTADSARMGRRCPNAAVHQLTSSLASPGSGLPEDCLAAALLPSTLDTPMNRKWMAKADKSTWTPLGTASQSYR